jgi:RimJ/RimL family protein N-acetyltransferase
MQHPHPLPGWLQQAMERNVGREPLWHFPDLAPASGLSFERLSFDNREVVLRMFEADADPFVSADFKAPEKLYEYVANLWINGPYSPKHGAADWIVHTAASEPAGLLHVYDVSCEQWALSDRRCSIGYTVAERFRGTGLAQQAVRALQSYLFERLDKLMLLAVPDRRNERSARFLTRLGYEERTEEYMGRETYRYFELYRDAEARRMMREPREQMA